MTTIAEKKSEVGVIAGFLVIVLGLAAIRGADGAPILAGDMRKVERACVAHG